MTAAADLMGLSEVAPALGVKRQRVYQLKIARMYPLPRPVCQLAATPVWLGSEIRQYQAEREQRRLARAR